MENAKREMRKKQELDERFKTGKDGAASSDEDSDVEDEDKIRDVEEAGAPLQPRAARLRLAGVKRRTALCAISEAQPCNGKGNMQACRLWSGCGNRLCLVASRASGVAACRDARCVSRQCTGLPAQRGRGVPPGHCAPAPLAS